MVLTVGTSLHHGKYVIQQPVDAGDRAVTYIATHTSLHGTVRLRTLHEPLQPEHCHQFLELGRRLYHCRHPHLARVLDSFVEQEQPFWVLEHPADESLADAIARQPLTQSDALRVVHQIGDAVAALHHHGVCHGAVSPQTILMRSMTPPMALLVGVSADGPARSPLGDVQDLARTLYTALTGQAMADAIDSLTILHTLRQAQPHLNPLIEQAILRSLQPADHQPFVGMAHWLSILPPVLPAVPSQPVAGAAEPPAPNSLAQSVSLSSAESEPDAIAAPGNAIHPAPARSAKRQFKPARSRWFPITVCVASVMAAIAGAGAGLMLRFDSPENSARNGLLFNSEQSFPVSDEWPGTSMTNIESSDYLFESPGWSPSEQPDYSLPGSLPEYVPPGETDEFYSRDQEPDYSPEPLTNNDAVGDRSKPDSIADPPSPNTLESDAPADTPDVPSQPSTDGKLEESPVFDPVIPDLEQSLPETFENESSVMAPEPEPLSRNPTVSEVVLQ